MLPDGRRDGALDADAQDVLEPERRGLLLLAGRLQHSVVRAEPETTPALGAFRAALPQGAGVADRLGEVNADGGGALGVGGR